MRRCSPADYGLVPNSCQCPQTHCKQLASLTVTMTASSHDGPAELKNVPRSECRLANSRTLLHSRKSLMHAWLINVWSLETLNDKSHRTCLATHANACVTERICVISLDVHFELNFLLASYEHGLIFSVLSFAVALMLKSANCLTSYPQ